MTDQQKLVLFDEFIVSDEGRKALSNGLVVDQPDGGRIDYSARWLRVREAMKDAFKKGLEIGAREKRDQEEKTRAIQPVLGQQ